MDRLIQFELTFCPEQGGAAANPGPQPDDTASAVPRSATLTGSTYPLCSFSSRRWY